MRAGPVKNVIGIRRAEALDGLQQAQGDAGLIGGERIRHLGSQRPIGPLPRRFDPLHLCQPFLHPLF